MALRSDERPAGASPLNAWLLRLRGRDKWPAVEARVFSNEFEDLPNQVGGEVGHYKTVYSYFVDGERYVGRFREYGSVNQSPLKRDDLIVVRYDPRRPQVSYYPKLMTRHRSQLIFAGVGLALALLSLGLSWLRRGRL